MPEVLDKVKPIIDKPFVFSSDIIDEIKKNNDVYRNFQNFSESYKRIRIAYIEESRDNKEEFKKRLDKFIEKTGENKLIKGFGSTDKYYC